MADDLSLYVVSTDHDAILDCKKQLATEAGMPRVCIDSGTGLPCADGFATLYPCDEEPILDADPMTDPKAKIVAWALPKPAKVPDKAKDKVQTLTSADLAKFKDDAKKVKP